MDHLERKNLIRTKWAETAKSLIEVSDEELVQIISDYEKNLVLAQTVFEAAKAENNRRYENRGKARTEAQRQLDRQYSPKPQDRVEFDKKKREEKVTVSKEEAAIQKIMAMGLKREVAEAMIAAGRK